MYFIIRFYHYFNTDSRCFKEEKEEKEQKKKTEKENKEKEKKEKENELIKKELYRKNG